MAGPKKRVDLNIDFTGVESGGRDLPNGNYILEVVSVEEKESQEGNAYLAWKWKCAQGPYKGTSVWDNTSMTPKALWRLKKLLDCLGVDTSQGKTGINFGELKGMTCGVKIENETYQGKQKPRIADFLRDLAPVADAGSAPSLKKGSAVTYDNDGEVVSGKVVSIDGKNAIIAVKVDGEEEEWEVPTSELKTDDIPY